MKIDYWKMRGWNVILKTSEPDEDFENVEEVVRTIDDLFEIISDILGEDDFFIEDIGLLKLLFTQ